MVGDGVAIRGELRAPRGVGIVDGNARNATARLRVCGEAQSPVWFVTRAGDAVGGAIP
jgi:hypothetical protein